MEAQRAFFAALAGKAQPTTAEAPAQAARAGTDSVAPPAATAAESPQKILRPGSIIDIRV